MKFDKSNELLQRELKVSPLGAQTYSKSYRYFCFGEAPLYAERAKGSRIYDVDGNEFIDFICALGPITVGYNDEDINNAAIEQIKKGGIFSIQSPIEVELCEKISQIISCAEKVRFVKNGGDATTAAVRLARSFTNKELVLMSGYHGMHDWSIGASANNKGVPVAVQNLTKNFAYNDIDGLRKLLEVYKDQVACVILEPIQGNGPIAGYLSDVKKLTEEYKTVLIFDEVVSGFRYALGGASELYGVKPDLIAFGKGMANGFSISALAGRSNIMDLIESGTFVSTTFGGDPVAMAAALATIKKLEKASSYKHIWELGTKMSEGIKRLILKYNLNDVLSLSGLPPHCGINFENSGDLSYLDINSIYSKAMVSNGIISHAICNINLSHTAEDIDKYLFATEEAFKIIKKAINQNSLDGLFSGNKINPVFKRNIR